jgi:flagella basal body P-ring formation protein FlgA
MKNLLTLCLILFPLSAFAQEPLTAEAALIPAATPVAQEQAPRNDFQIMYTDAEDAVSKALIAKGVSDKVSALINGRKKAPIAAFSKPATVETRGLQYDQQTHRWSANLIFSADGDVLTAMPVSGHFEEIVEIPVLKREVRGGEIIAGTDIEIRDFPVSRTRSDTVNDLSSMIGKAPVRSIAPFRPVRENELASPAIMKKNAIVKVLYRAPGMEISISGQALTDGAKGDVIDIKNTTSKKIVRAMIEDASNVTIISPGTTLSDNSVSIQGGTHATN